MKTLLTWSLGFALLAALSFRSARAAEPTLPGLENESNAEARDAVLKSPEWYNTMVALSRWLAAQQIYNKNQVSQFVRQVNVKVKSMSAEELTDYMHGLDAKLAVLNGSEGRSARKYFREQLSLASDEYGAKMKKKLPNLSTMSADDIQSYLDNFEIRRGQTATASKMLEQGREQQAQAIKEKWQRERDYRDRALDRAVEGASYGGSPLGYSVVPGRDYGGYRW